jgi:hypothetical protein
MPRLGENDSSAKAPVMRTRDAWVGSVQILASACLQCIFEQPLGMQLSACRLAEIENALDPLAVSDIRIAPAHSKTVVQAAPPLPVRNISVVLANHRVSEDISRQCVVKEIVRAHEHDEIRIERLDHAGHSVQ